MSLHRTLYLIAYHCIEFSSERKTASKHPEKNYSFKHTYATYA
uniref:Uncharacterized protein n=1 Tax=Anguilla anguilla TaxID=7936 RepID=A0A0E9SF99_ANGAN